MSQWYSVKHKRWRLDRWVGKTPWRRKWQLTPVFSTRKSHGQWSLASYSSWDSKGLDTTEHSLATRKTQHHENYEMQMKSPMRCLFSLNRLAYFKEPDNLECSGGSKPFHKSYRWEYTLTSFSGVSVIKNILLPV